MEVIRYWWSKAEESLLSAQRELDAMALGFAMNRTYYAAFYAVSAALLERHASFKKHSGVRAAFHREFVKSGLLDIKWSKFYDQLFEDRQEGDYLALVDFETDYVKNQLTRCQEFLADLRPLISTLSGQ
jgi:uncharacterized protein (UPF0332 family)